MSIGKTLGTAVLSSALLMLFSCESDSYDTGTGTYSLMTAEFGEAYTDEEGVLKFFTTDDDVSLTLSPEVSYSDAKPDTLYRRLLYYDVADGNIVEPRAITVVPVAYPHPALAFDSVYTDPVSFESLWVSASGKYINMGLYFLTGEADGSDDLRHTVGIAVDSVVTDDNLLSTYHMRLYHDQGGIPEYYSTKYFISIPTTSIPAADSVVMRINTYDGTVTKGVGL